MFDLVLRGGRVIDGTGAPARAADVAVADGRIVEVGAADGPTRRTIDADGLVVAPGVVDIHTHYDAQVCWDGYATPSILHGVTTVIGGNCGFTLAPAGPDDRGYLAAMLARVEGMSIDALAAGVPWDWESFGGYLDRLDGRLGINAGFLVGHTTLRHHAMGADFERPATPDELSTMERLLGESLAAGGLGFSTSISVTHNDATGGPVPSRFADHAELVALARATGRYPGTTLEMVPSPGAFADEVVELMTAMSVAADRPLNWNLINVSTAMAAATEQRLGASDRAAERGGCLVGLVLPDTASTRLNFVGGFLLDAIPGFAPLFALSPADRIRALADPAMRAKLRDAASSDGGRALYYITEWHNIRIGQTFTAANAGLDGRLVGEIAAERGIDPLDAMLDVVVADDLRTVLVTPPRGDDAASWALREQAIRDRRTVPGGSDSGAHLDMLDTFTMATRLLGPNVRDRGLLTLEEAVHLLTGVPAGLYGITGRGRLAEGACADVLVFDPTRIDAGPVEIRHDLPAGAPRLYGEAEGVHHVFVNGEEVVSGKELTDALPGRVIRSGRDTTTVTAGDARRAAWRN